MENVDQTYAHPVKKTWKMTRELVEIIDSEVNVSNATSMKRTGEFLCPEITQLTDMNAELVPMVKFSLEVGAKIAQGINTLKTMYASATTTIESKKEDKMQVNADQTIATTDNKLLKELVPEEVIDYKVLVKLVPRDSSLMMIEDHANHSIALEIRLRQMMEDALIVLKIISIQMINKPVAENQIALLTKIQILCSFTEMEHADLAQQVKLF